MTSGDYEKRCNAFVPKAGQVREVLRDDEATASHLKVLELRCLTGD